MAASKISCGGNLPCAVILGLGPTPLALIRALGRKGVPIYGIGFSKYEAGMWSRYCHPLGVADPQDDAKTMLHMLLQFGQAQHAIPPVLYPSSDSCVAFIADNHEILSRYYRFSPLTHQIAERFLNKAEFYKACLANGMPAPTTFVPTSAEALRAVSRQIRYPCIAKPKYYHRWATKNGLLKGVVCQTPDDLRKFGDKYVNELDNFIVQEIMDGPETDIFVFAAYFDKNSTPHGIFTGRKVRQYPVGFGTTTMMTTADRPELVEMSVKFLRKVGYQGLCDVEYKLDRTDNSFKIIEINPRLGRWYGIVEAAGHDTVYWSYLDLTDQPIPCTDSRSKQVSWVLTSRDLPAILKGKDWTLLKALRSYRGPKTWGVWARDDVGPFLAYFAEAVAKLRRLHRAKVSEDAYSRAPEQQRLNLRS